MLIRNVFGPRVVALVCAALFGVAAAAGAGQMDLRQASGVPLPAADLPAGTISVRVVRGSFANNLAGQTVTFTVNGSERTGTTDAGGRTQVAGLAKGTSVRARVTVDGERLESQEMTVGDTGIRIVLVAQAAAPGAGTSASAAPAPPGSVTLGGDSRIVVDFAEERLNIYYVVQVVNAAAVPADLGGPLVFELPQGARGATVMDGSSPNATVSGARVTLTGPFAPGQTDVNIAFELPFTGNQATLTQVWPADAAPFTILAVKTGELDITSPQVTGKRNSAQQGQALVAGMTTAVAKGSEFTALITGLPAHPLWPRNLAFLAASLIILVGLWSAFGPTAGRRFA